VTIYPQLRKPFVSYRNKKISGLLYSHKHRNDLATMLLFSPPVKV
jgi:hypothetical protein